MIKYKQSPIYYTGNKFKLLKFIEPFFPKDIDNFHDVFGGGGTVAINANANKIHFNDIDFTYGLMETLLNRTPEVEVKKDSENDRSKGLKVLDSRGIEDNTGLGYTVIQKEGNVEMITLGHAHCDCIPITIKVPKGVGLVV